MFLTVGSCLESPLQKGPVAYSLEICWMKANVICCLALLSTDTEIRVSWGHITYHAHYDIVVVLPRMGGVLGILVVVVAVKVGWRCPKDI